MKCDKLESFHHYEDMVITPATHMYRVYRADEVDAAIAELKSENKMLKAKLENVQASARADSVDAGMRERRLRRALYKACANWAKSFKTTAEMLGAHADAVKWDNVERKCLKKAEEYR